MLTKSLYITCIVGLIAVSGVVAFWSMTSSQFAGSPIGATSIMEIPVQSSYCMTGPAEASHSGVSSKDENVSKPGICREDWITGWDGPVYSCDTLFGPV